MSISTDKNDLASDPTLEAVQMCSTASSIHSPSSSIRLNDPFEERIQVIAENIFADYVEISLTFPIIRAANMLVIYRDYCMKHRGKPLTLLHSLPPDLIKYKLGPFLSLEQLKVLEQLDPRARQGIIEKARCLRYTGNNVEEAEKYIEERVGFIEKARKYGYTGDNNEEAQKYLYVLFYEVQQLIDRHLPVKYIVRPKWLSNKCDYEPTLKKLSSLSAEEMADVFCQSYHCFYLIKYLTQVAKEKQLKMPQPKMEHVTTLQEFFNDYSELKAVGIGFTHRIDLDDLRLMLEFYSALFSVNLMDSNGDTYLHKALKLEKPPEEKILEIVQELLNHGANPNLVNKDGDAPLHIAARHNHLFLMQILLNRSAHPDVKNHLGDGPLHIAVRNENGQAMQLLLEKKANPNLKTCATDLRIASQQGDTPLHIIVKEDSLSSLRLMQILLTKADPNIANNDGDTPLHMIARRRPLHHYVRMENVQLMRALLDRGGNLNVVNKAGETPLSLISVCFLL